MSSLSLLEAPWTPEQVESLNGYQGDGIFHPFTHENSEGKKIVLTATVDGWVVEKGGPVVQNWCHHWMANWAWKRT